MLRWMGTGVAAALAFAACQSATPPAQGDDAGDDDDAGACTPCQVSGSGGTIDIACGLTACVDAIDYLCSTGGEGVIEVGGCAGSDDAGGDATFVTLDSGEAAACVPRCVPGECGGSDGCNGTCGCSNDLTCDTTMGLCVSPCEEGVGDPCTPGSTSGALCCVDQTECQARDSGVASCCAMSGIPGLCQADQDCCGYPTLRCNQATMQCQ